MPELPVPVLVIEQRRAWLVFVQVPVTVQVPPFTKVATCVPTKFETAETLVAIAPLRAKINANVDKTILVIFMIDKCLEFYNN